MGWALCLPFFKYELKEKFQYTDKKSEFKENFQYTYKIIETPKSFQYTDSMKGVVGC